MKTVVAPLALQVLAAVSGSANAALFHTFVRYQSSRTICATLQYTDDLLASSNSINRKIAPQTSQGDEYNPLVLNASVEIWLEGSQTSYTAKIKSDDSVVAFDNENKSAVEIFLAKHGTLVQKDNGQVLLTVYP